MSVGGCTILGMETYQKYTWVCTGDCDGLFELTFKDGFGWPNGVMQYTCPCGSNCALVSVEDATIHPTNEGKQMLDNLEAYMDLGNTYDANTLVTYKDITDGVTSYPTLKVNELEYKLDRIKRLESQLEISNGQIRQILDNMSAEGWYNPNYEKSEVLNDLCEILGHEPKQEIIITGTINFEVRYDCPLEEVEDFDARYFMQDNLTLDSFHGDVVIESFDVEDAEVQY